MGIQDLEKEFQEDLGLFQERDTVLIPGEVDFGESMSLRISLRRRSTTEVLNMGIDAAVIEANNRLNNR